MNYLDKNGVELKKGMIVAFQNGTRRGIKYDENDQPVRDENGMLVKEEVPYMNSGRITRITSKWANIGTVWGGKVFAKMIPLEELEDYTEQFYDNWSKSESYRCM
jgi:hypothetical protein